MTRGNVGKCSSNCSPLLFVGLANADRSLGPSSTEAANTDGIRSRGIENYRGHRINAGIKIPLGLATNVVVICCLSFGEPNALTQKTFELLRPRNAEPGALANADRRHKRP